MSEQIDKTGGPAYPCYVPIFSDQHGVGGMTLRDYFAAAALTGWMANSQRLKNMQREDIPSDAAMAAGAKWSYACADAMLIERERKQ